MTPKDKRKYKEWIKKRYPIGSEVWDDSSSEPLRIRKDTIFEVFEDDPAEGPPTEITFTARQPGKHTSRWQFRTVPINWID